MKKLVVTAFSIILLGFSYLGIDHRLYFTPMLINLSRPFMLTRILLVTVFLFYTFIPWLRLHFFKILLFTSGLIFVLLGLATIYSPGLFGHLNNWILLGDSLTAIEVGIISIVLSSELNYRKTEYLIKSYYHLRLIFVKRFENFEYVYSLVLMYAEIILQDIRGSIADIFELISKELNRPVNIESNVPP
jgi:hypothetical protein